MLLPPSPDRSPLELSHAAVGPLDTESSHEAVIPRANGCSDIERNNICALPRSVLLDPEKHAFIGTAPTEPIDELTVWWEEPEDQDPENPMNWPAKLKWANILIISCISFLV